MLVYVNQLKFVGDNALNDVFRTIAGWLKEQTKHHFKKEELLSGQEFRFGGQWVRTYRADDREPYLYGILFSNPDISVSGRQWITEIGIRADSDSVICSVLLETSDISTRVRDIPVTTKPKLIKYLIKNCQPAPETVGTSIQKVEPDEDSLKSFLASVERPERNHPIVLVSHRFDGTTVISPRTLQGHLVGLAQVVVVDEHMDSWFMERVVGRRYSAWGGAINIIYPSGGRDFCRNKLYVFDELEGLLSESVNINLDILSRITHYSNGRKKRQHFSPYDVRAKRAADFRHSLKERYESAAESEEQYELLEQAFEQIEEYENILKLKEEDFQKQLEAANQEILDLLENNEEKESEIWRLKAKISALESAGTESHASRLPVSVLESLRSPTPEKCLQVLESTFPDRIEIIESAWKSARESDKFRNVQKLADLLLRLSTDYYEKISSGPDSEARKVFGSNEFAAQESESVRNNAELSRKRTFEYRGAKVQMYRHLKIGVADNVSETIRVHFHWDSDRKKIVIGYCGPHLPVISHVK